MTLTVHLVKIWNLVYIADVYNREALDLVRDFVQDLILAHAVRIPVATETNDNKSFLLAKNGLVHVPAGVEMGNDNGTHGFKLNREKRENSAALDGKLRAVGIFYSVMV